MKKTGFFTVAVLMSAAIFVCKAEEKKITAPLKKKKKKELKKELDKTVTVKAKVSLTNEKVKDEDILLPEFSQVSLSVARINIGVVARLRSDEISKCNGLIKRLENNWSFYYEPVDTKFFPLLKGKKYYLCVAFYENAFSYGTVFTKDALAAKGIQYDVMNPGYYSGVSASEAEGYMNLYGEVGLHSIIPLSKHIALLSYLRNADDPFKDDLWDDDTLRNWHLERANVIIYSLERESRRKIDTQEYGIYDRTPSIDLAILPMQQVILIATHAEPGRAFACPSVITIIFNKDGTVAYKSNLRRSKIEKETGSQFAVTDHGKGKKETWEWDGHSFLKKRSIRLKEEESCLTGH